MSRTADYHKDKFTLITFFLFMKINATDADQGKNADIRYQISSLTDPGVARMFSIDPISGWVSTDWTLDYESQSSVRRRLQIDKLILISSLLLLFQIGVMSRYFLSCMHEWR